MDARDNSPAAPRGWSPATVVRPLVRPPSSKSHAIRALLAAGLARGNTRLLGLSRSEDVLAALGVVEGLGARVERHPGGDLTVHGLGRGDCQPRSALDAGESGTLARLTTCLLALATPAGSQSRLIVRGSLRRRFSAPLLECLVNAGATLTPEGALGSWPLGIRSVEAASRLRLRDPASSQELSGLLLALATRAGKGSVEVTGSLPSRPYVDMTVEVLRAFGARTTERGGVHEVVGPLVAPADELELEPDASAAAVALAAACLSDGATRVQGFGASCLQGDVAIAEHLAAFGCVSSFEDGALVARGFPTRAASIDLSQHPDLAPVLIAVAGGLALRTRDGDARSVICGLGTLNSKECRRLDVLAGALRALGLEVVATDDSLEISPGTPCTRALVLDPEGDHRMAFAFALLGLVRPGLTVSDPDCVAKSWPNFWEACTEAAHAQNPDGLPGSARPPSPKAS